MVALREARRAFHRFRHVCFWSYRDDVVIREDDILWVIRGLMNEGDRSAYDCEHNPAFRNNWCWILDSVCE